MPKTKAPIVWDFWQKVDVEDAISTGAVLHFADTHVQRIIPKESGLVSNNGVVEHGHWSDVDWSEFSEMQNMPYIMIDTDHPHADSWYGVGIKESGGVQKFEIFEHHLNLLLNDYVISGTFKAQTDNPITMTTLTITNVWNSILVPDAYAIYPGQRIEVGITLGDSKVYKIAVMFIEEVSYDILSNSITLSGRNTIGYMLANQNFKSAMLYVGDFVSEYIIRILEYFGIEDYDVQPIEKNAAFGFDAGTTGLEAIQNIANNLTILGEEGVTEIFKIVELPDGKIVCGYADFIAQYEKNTYCRIRGKEDLYRCKINRTTDGIYTHLHLTGQTSEGETLLAESRDIEQQIGWYIGSERTYFEHIENVTQEELAQIADNDVIMMQGRNETAQLTTYIMPQLMIGDYMILDIDGEDQRLGVVTELSHRMGRNGFFSDIVTDSNGGVWEYDDRIETRTMSIEGNARKKRMTDLFNIKK